MVNNRKNKAGFSLFEACVVMLIVGIFTALCANSFSKRHVTYQEADGHGRYECYRNAGGQLMQRYVENNSSRYVTGTNCIFRPPRYAKYILLNAIGGGSADAAGEFKSVFYSSIETPLTIIPGNANEQTVINDNAATLLTASAGKGNMIATSEEADTIKSCNFTYQKYSCGATPICRQDGQNLSVSFCRSSTEFTTQKISLTDIKQYRASYNGDTVVYRDLSDYTSHGVAPADALALLDEGSYETYYTINVVFDLTLSDVSQMETYLEALDITDGIGSPSIQPGRPGKAGAAVILW